MTSQLTHLNADGQAQMVDVSDKPDTERIAVAEGFVIMQPETLNLIQEAGIKKGDVLTVAKIAGIVGAKQTSNLIPLCHPLPLTKVEVELELILDINAVRVVVTTKTTGKTGVEMEALTAVSIACLTVYDMAKAVDRGMQIQSIRLLEKRGGVHGDYVAESGA